MLTDNEIKKRKWATCGDNSSPLFYPLPPSFLYLF